MAKSDLDYYQILGVTRHASDDEIKKAFRKLARDTHPDKNPNDPTSKERFQNVQHAYDTLKDTLERSKYDNDNPSHGYGGAHGAAGTARGTPGTRTAKRYTSTTTPSSHTHTPGWKTGTTWTEGYAERAAGATPSRASRGAGFYEYTEAPEPAQTKRTPRPQYNYNSRTYEDAYSTKTRDSAYSRTSRTTPTHQPRPKSTAPQHSSTSTRYAPGSGGTSTPTGQSDFDLGSYIRERRAKELAQQEAEQKRAERDSSGSGSERRKHSTSEREREKARDESRRAEHEARAKYSPKNDPYSDYHTPGSFPGDEEDLMKEADQRMRDAQNGQRKSTRHSASYPSGTKKPSPRPTTERTASTGASGYYPSSKQDNVHVYDANPDEESEDEKPSYTSMPRKTDYSKQPRAEYFASNTQWPSSGFNFGGDFTPSTGPKKTAFDNVNVHHATPPHSPGGRKMKEATPPRRTKSMGASKATEAEPPKFAFTSVDPFAFQEPPTDTDSTPRRPATTTNYDFNFSGGMFGHGVSPRFGSGPFTTRNSPEPQKKAEEASNDGPTGRPSSQPTVASPKVEMLFRGAPPPQGVAKKQTPKPVKKELWENLLNTTSAYEYQASEGSNAARKKRSVPGLKKGKNRERRASADDKHRNSTDSGSEDDTKAPERMEGPFRPTSAAPFSTPSSAFPQPQAPQNATAAAPEPMDTTPDFTNSPKPQPQPQPQVHIPDVFADLSGLKLDGAPTANPFANGFTSTPSAGIDLSNLGAVPPLAPNPAEAGLGGFGDLKTTLPFQSRAADKPPINRTPSNSSSNAKAPKPRMAPPPPPAFGAASFMDQFPPTPYDEDGPLDIPTPPRAIKVPSIVSLSAYNKTYEALGKYFAEWQEYEKKVSALRTQLDLQHTIPLEKKSSGEWAPPRADVVEKYLTKLSDRDTRLDESFRKARKEHIKILRQWMKCREQVICLREGEDGVTGRPGEEGYRGAVPVGYSR